MPASILRQMLTVQLGYSERLRVAIPLRSLDNIQTEYTLKHDSVKQNDFYIARLYIKRFLKVNFSTL